MLYIRCKSSLTKQEIKLAECNLFVNFIDKLLSVRTTEETPKERRSLMRITNILRFKKASFCSAVESFFYAAARGGAQHPEQCLLEWQILRQPMWVLPSTVRRVVESSFENLSENIQTSNTARFVTFTFPSNEIARYESCEGTVVTLEFGKGWSGEKEVHLIINGHESSVKGRINAIPDALIERICPQFAGAFECEPNCPKCEREKAKKEVRIIGTPVIPPVAPPPAA